MSVPDLEHPPKASGRYDIRRGSAGYAPIVATFGALAVAAIVLLLTFPPKPIKQETPDIALAAGLLMAVVIGCFASSIGFAAIGAELDPTANLVPATMFLAVPAALSFTALLAAFEILAASYLPGSYTKLFIVMVGAGGLLGSFFTGLSVGDAWHAGPTDEATWNRWKETQWEAIRSREQGETWANRVTATAAVPGILAMTLRPLGVGFSLTVISANVLVGAAFGITVLATMLGMLRTVHAAEERQKGLRRQEAFMTAVTISTYTFVLTLFLPIGK